MSRNILNEICALLETYKGRDKILRTLCYITKLIGGAHGNPNIAKKFLYISSHLSRTRATLRLLDDFPMLQYSIKYGLGSEEPDKIMAKLGVVTNIIDHIYYPIEKMAFLAEHKLFTGIDNSKWDNLSTICWVLSIYLSLLKTFRYIAIIERQKGRLDKTKSVSLQKLINSQKYEWLTSLRLTIDLIYAIHYLPQGFLWSTKLQTWHVGLLGSISSILGITQVYYKRSLAL